MESLRDAVEQAAERTGFSGVVRVDRSGGDRARAAYGFADRAHGMRTRWDPVRDRERDEGVHGAGGDGPGRARGPRARHDRPLGARRRPAADRRRRDGRAPAGAPLRDRRLRRRGGGRATSPTTCCRCRCTSSRRPSGTCPSWTGTRRVPGRRAVRLQQRWLRRARVDRRAGERGGLPRPGPARWSASRPAWSTPRSCAPMSSPAAPPGATCAPTACGRTCSTCRFSAPATAASTRRRPTSAPLGCAVRRADRPARARRRDGAAAQRLAGGERRYGLGFHLHATSDGVWLEGYDAGCRS